MPEAVDGTEQKRKKKKKTSMCQCLCVQEVGVVTYLSEHKQLRNTTEIFHTEPNPTNSDRADDIMALEDSTFDFGVISLCFSKRGH